MLAKAAEEQGVTEFTARFLFSEWTYVLDAWQLDSLEAYANVPRLGRKNRMSAKQRARCGQYLLLHAKLSKDAASTHGPNFWRGDGILFRARAQAISIHCR